ncbi:PLP-dependent cysteine synthase family protein [Candidatus Chromulinivorax destructor]|uniref:Cystathionine beta-synthase n=1 Tax=Candidatus Chromulinivorax destructor TaxID=2066483 RepID=A0A345ZB78_9BACT|nr:cysteine synthase family protein [Candidatus Chromulinivorax destructor]AXK60545.1 cystathionine beta-synthase [Candidatus Chromulinivorax destructor]
MMHNNLLQAIGNTPLVQVDLQTPCQLYAKLEYLNPGGSVKDRSSLFMIEDAEQRGILQPGGTIIDASSGNQGIATAMIGAIKGYKVIIAVSEKVSKEKLETLKAYGAQVVMCPATSFLQDPNSYHSQAMRIHKETPNSFMPDQYFNLANAMAHYKSLGPEIWRQTEGKITHFIAAAGTGGTISGAGRFLKEQNPNIKIIAVDSNVSYRSTKGHPQPYAIEGMGVDFDSPVLNYDIVDEFFEAPDAQSLAMLQHLARNKGILAGPSSGAVAYAAEQYCKQLKPTDLAVMIMGDSGRAYLTKNFY